MPSLTDDAVSWPEPEQQAAPGVAYDPMVQLYYQNFHRSHPLLVPRKALASHLCDRMPAYLFAIMRYIGAHFYPDPAFKEEFRAPAYAVLADSVAQDGFKVQGMLLLAIVEHAHGQDDSAHRTMQAAIDLALELGMHRSSFAVEHSRGDFTMEESWCRTFWELYVVDGLLATMRDQSSFRLCRQRTDVRLPCAEDAYTAGVAVRLSSPAFPDSANAMISQYPSGRLSPISNAPCPSDKATARPPSPTGSTPSRPSAKSWT